MINELPPKWAIIPEEEGDHVLSHERESAMKRYATEKAIAMAKAFDALATGWETGNGIRASCEL